MKQIILAVLLVIFVPVAAQATALSITTSDFVSGGQIKSGTFLTMSAEIEAWANGNVGTDNIADSGLTFNFFGANSVNSTHLADRAVQGRHFDSGCINSNNSDTIFGYGLDLTDKMVSTSDTWNNWAKVMWGYYQGDGTDSRWIHTNYSTYSDSNGGETITMTIKSVTIYPDTTSGLVSPETINWTYQIGYYLRDGAVVNYGVGQGWGAGYTATGAYIPPYGSTSSDSSYFTINNEGSHPLNENGYNYIFRVEGE